MNALDRLISYLAPGAALKRMAARASLQQIAQLTGTPKGPYAAANVTRLNALAQPVTKENQVSGSRVDSLRSQSWDLYRDNPSARKIVRTIVAKVVGKRGMMPESLAMNSDGTPNVEFRAKAQELWQRIQSGFDSRGLPGRGGVTFAQLQKLALRATVLSGDTFYRLVPIDQTKQRRHDLPIPITLQMIDACRLADESEIVRPEIPEGHTVYRGIELNADGERVAYHVRIQPAWASANQPGNVRRFTVDQIGHLYSEEDIDQLRGIPWFAAALVKTRNTEDLDYNVLKATAMAACIVGTYSKPTGAARVGLAAGINPVASSIDGSDLTDGDGNTVTKIQPGMMLNVGKDGKFELLSPSQPNKSSTVTGDYRNSSFSSERSADNDAWPELHDVQEWFASSFCHPIYEAVIRAGILSNFFDGIVSAAEFQADPGRFSVANWQGPVALSINPKDDAEAAAARIHAGLSSLQMETAKINVNWRDVLNDNAELYAIAEAKGIPAEVVNNILGVDTADQIAVAQANADAAAADTQQPRKAGNEVQHVTTI